MLKKNLKSAATKGLAVLTALCLTMAAAGCGSTESQNAPAGESGQKETSVNTEQTAAAQAETVDATNTGSNNYAEGSERTQGGELNNVTSMFTGFFQPQSQTTAMEVCWPALESLAYQTADGEWHPRLAESWEVDRENAHTVTIHLKQGISFDNGDPFDADDVVFTYMSRFDYGTQSNIGAPASVEKVDDYTVVVTYDAFSLDYESWLLPQFMYSKETFDEKGEDWMINNIVGTGPYKMKEYIPDESLSFVRNDNYWGEPGNVDTLSFRLIQDSTAQTAAFLNGEIDRIVANSPTVYKLLTDNGYTPVISKAAVGQQNSIVPITMNPDDPLSKKEVRQAIYQFGIDWDVMAETLGGGTFYHTDAYALPENTYYTEDLEFTAGADYEKCKSMIADAGYPDGFSTSIYYGSNSIGGTAASIATFVQAELAKCGITVECVPVDGTVLSSEYWAGKSVDSGMIVSGLYYTPLQTLRLNQTDGPTGAHRAVTTWSDEILQKFDEVNAATSQEEQDRLMREFVTMFVQEECIYWPAINGRTPEFYQSWCHYSENARIGNAGFDSHEIWVDAH